MLEQRRQMRRRTLFDGDIRIEKLNAWSLECAVRNLSDGGARITIPGAIVVPERFDLAISGGEGRKARLVWYRDGQAGVAFDEPGATGKALAAHGVDGARDAIASTPTGILAARIAAVSARRPRAPEPNTLSRGPTPG